jgi:hypothetical protein
VTTHLVLDGRWCTPVDIGQQVQAALTAVARVSLCLRDEEARSVVADHNWVRHRPIQIDALWLQAQVSDGNQQLGRILQAQAHSGISLTFLGKRSAPGETKGEEANTPRMTVSSWSYGSAHS